MLMYCLCLQLKIDGDFLYFLADMAVMAVNNVILIRSFYLCPLFKH